MRSVERLCLAHLWVAFAAFFVACLLGTWQMWVRSPMGRQCRHPRPILHVGDGARRRDGLRAHHLLRDGFRLFLRRRALHWDRPFPVARPGAWGAFWAAIVGVILVVHPDRGLGQASVLFTFYPPLTALPPGSISALSSSWWRRGSGAYSCCGDERSGSVKIQAAVPALHVCHRRQCGHVALDDVRRRGPVGLSGHSRRVSASPRRSMWAFPERCFPGRFTRSSISG